MRLEDGVALSGAGSRGSRERVEGNRRSTTAGGRLIVEGKVAKRRETRIAGIIDCAWALARDEGIAGVSLHALARELGIRQPSLYEYFASKNALYDAMFADGNQKLLNRLDSLRLPRDPRAALKRFLSAFAAFGLEDPARYELMFQRHVPGFTPSEGSYGLAEQVLGRAVARMQAAGVGQPGDIDCLVAVVAGLMEAQLSNDPGGNRWVRHLNRLVDLVVDDATKGATNES
ncbi:MAG TPA: TetR/AcrR family transcriptional regulator [Acidimicrobiales bacterium]|nr:TetR/AcrR family transcriptional regulator [Acidimicrobiales bacterium]